MAAATPLSCPPCFLGHCVRRPGQKIHIWTNENFHEIEIEIENFVYGLSQEHSEVLLNFKKMCSIFSFPLFVLCPINHPSPFGRVPSWPTRPNEVISDPIPFHLEHHFIWYCLLSPPSSYFHLQRVLKVTPVVEGPNLPCQRIQGLMNSLELVCPSFQHLLTRWNNHKARSCWIRLREPWQTLPLVRFPASLAFVRASKSKLVGKHSIAVSLFGWSKQILCQYRPSPNRVSDGKIQTTILILLLRRCPALSLDIAFHCYVSRTCSLAILDQNWQGLISYQLSNVGGLALDPVQSVSYTCSFWVCCGATFICDVLGRISKLIRHSYQCGYWVSNFT